VRRIALAASLTAAVLTVVACGAGEDDSAVPEGEHSRVQIIARDISFSASTYEATRGAVEIDYRNDGAMMHSLKIAEIDGFELKVAKHGDSDADTIDLEPGNYIVYCDVPGHRAAGMEATLEVD